MSIDSIRGPAAGDYAARASAFRADLATLRRASSRLSNSRLAVFLVTCGLFLWLVMVNRAAPALLVLAAGVIAFAVLVVRHGRVVSRERLAESMARINEAGSLRMEGRWTRFPADGHEFVDDAHPFSSDLDIFGPASLFQWIGAAQTRMGRERLRDRLAGAPRSVADIAVDQDSLRELASRLDWRQQFEAAGRFLVRGRGDEEPLLDWAEDRREIFSRPLLAAGLRLLPLLSLCVMAWSWFVLRGSAGVLLPLFVQMAIAGWNRQKTGDLLGQVARRKEELETYLELLRLLGAGDFAAPGLKSLAAALRNPQGTQAWEAIRRLRGMVEWMETRRNPILHFLVNTLLLWDIQWLWAFRRWRAENGPSLRAWLSAVAEAETLASLAAIPFENPDWAWPEVREDGERDAAAAPPLLDAEAMGHPLLPADKRVCNSLRIARPGEALIVTGSNMSGKSTLLRTVGINLVLAYAGAPVCAVAFRCRRVELRTCMRLRDDLEQGISSFHAELLRVKGIVEAAKAGGPVLYLVDEIFRGTNSRDRHEGAMAVLRRLHALGAAGLVSTHDLELARLEALEPAHFRNVHFQESWEDGAIRFDYRLREGVSTTTNAIHLIRMAGLADVP
ncbi:MAG TPA: MutS family DNA mismatch repair protein [Fibrobacteria bacterium]|nr:MutS family DNA mismatch repair protein [Fibrobacteria bacterium]